MMARYRKKPVEIEAVQLCWRTWGEVCDAFGEHLGSGTEIGPDSVSSTTGESGPTYIAVPIHTMEGNVIAKHGDWLIQGVNGEVYPCHPDVFAKTYEPVQPESTQADSNGGDH